MSWKNLPITEKQESAINNMARALGLKIKKMPETKGEASEIISELKKTINNNLQVTGSINPSPAQMDDEGEEYIDPIY